MIWSLFFGPAFVIFFELLAWFSFAVSFDQCLWTLSSQFLPQDLCLFSHWSFRLVFRLLFNLYKENKPTFTYLIYFTNNYFVKTNSSSLKWDHWKNLPMSSTGLSVETIENELKKDTKLSVKIDNRNAIILKQLVLNVFHINQKQPRKRR